MLISIVVTIYNTQDYLRECLDSIIKQMKDYSELILVDDGSTDLSGRICDEYRDKNESLNITVIHKVNGGCVAARKTGIKTAIGEYVCFVDSDDFIDCGCIERMHQIIVGHAYDIIAFDNQSMYDDGRIIKDNLAAKGGFYNKHRMETELYPIMVFSKELRMPALSPSLCNKYIKRSLINEVAIGVDEMISSGEDVAVSYECLLRADTFYYDKGYCGYTYRIRKDSLEHSISGNDANKIVVLIDYLLDRFSIYPYPQLREQLFYYAAWQYSRTIEPFLNDNENANHIYSQIKDSKGGKWFKNEIFRLKKCSEYQWVILNWVFRPSIKTQMRLVLFQKWNAFRTIVIYLGSRIRNRGESN